VILETIVTTLDPAGVPRFAAMGVVWGEESITIRPFVNTRTYRNLTASREAVVNVTDDVLLFATSALTHAHLPSEPARQVRGVVLRDACHWREVVVERVVSPAPSGSPGPTGSDPGRAEVLTRVVTGGAHRPFAGLCRAKHAVVEASILASRHRLVPREEIMRELARLDVLVEKTGGQTERAAMTFIRDYLATTRPGGIPPARSGVR
jgi:uncharacterized protein